MSALTELPDTLEGRSLGACMNCYCRSRNACVAAAVVEELIERVSEAEGDIDSCLYGHLLRKWQYIMGSHFRADRFVLTGRKPCASDVAGSTSQVLQFQKNPASGMVPPGQ